MLIQMSQLLINKERENKTRKPHNYLVIHFVLQKVSDFTRPYCKQKTTSSARLRHLNVFQRKMENKKQNQKTNIQIKPNQNKIKIPKNPQTTQTKEYPPKPAQRKPRPSQNTHPPSNQPSNQPK